MGKRILIASGSVDVWHKPLNQDHDAFVLFNNLKSYTPVYVELSLKTLQLSKFQKYLFYESFTGNLIGRFDQSVNTTFKVYVNSYYNILSFWTQPDLSPLVKVDNQANLWESITPPPVASKQKGHKKKHNKMKTKLKKLKLKNKHNLLM